MREENSRIGHGELIISSWFLPPSKNNSCIITHACHFVSFLQAAYIALSHICSRTANCMFTLFPICGIHAELVHCLYSRRKAGNREIQDPMPSTENVHGKATPQHRSYSLLLETGQKAGESVPSLSCSPQNYHKDNSSPLTQLLQLWFFARKFFP